jgi:hypothetical protein
VNEIREAPHLSERQVEVCCLVAAGESDKAIAKDRTISVAAVRFHMKEAARRLRFGMPHLSGSPRQIILGYYAAVYGVAAFEERRRSRAA